MSSVFVIINEWEGFDGKVSSALFGEVYYESIEDARKVLTILAAHYDVELEPDATSLTLVPLVENLEWEEYYIQELTKEESN